MEKDKDIIERMISEMLDKPVYPLPDTARKIAEYIDSARAEVLGWAYADACTHIDNEQDYRLVEVPTILNRMQSDLSK